MDEIYETYRCHVTAIRASRLKKKPLDELAGGRVFTGAQAFELGLIDKIGTLDDAIVHVAGQAGLSGYDVRVVPRAKNFLEVLMEQSGNDEADRKGLDVAAGRPLPPAAGSLPLFELAAPDLKMLDPARAALVRQALGRIELLQREGVVLMMPEMMMGR